MQLVKEVRSPLAASPQRPRRVDYEYERPGKAESLPVLPAAGGLASGDGPGPMYECGLGDGGRRAVPGRRNYANWR